MRALMNEICIKVNIVPGSSENEALQLAKLTQAGDDDR